jgi:hypothetical protein
VVRQYELNGGYTLTILSVRLKVVRIVIAHRSPFALPARDVVGVVNGVGEEGAETRDLGLLGLELGLEGLKADVGRGWRFGDVG